MNTHIEKSGTGAITRIKNSAAVLVLVVVSIFSNAQAAQEYKTDGLTITIDRDTGFVAAVFQENKSSSFLVGSGHLTKGFGAISLIGPDSIAKVDGAGTGAGKVDGAGTGASKVDGAGTGADKVDGAGTGAQKNASEFSLEILDAHGEVGMVAVLRNHFKGETISEVVFDTRDGQLRTLEQLLVSDF